MVMNVGDHVNGYGSVKVKAVTCFDIDITFCKRSCRRVG